VRLFHHDFPRCTVNGDEIYAIGQIVHADLLFFGRDLAFYHGLADGNLQNTVINAVAFGRILLFLQREQKKFGL
jgi:hypothetical protein